MLSRNRGKVSHYAFAYAGFLILIALLTFCVAAIFPEIPFFKKDDDSIWSLSNDILQILLWLGAAFSVIGWFNEKRRQREEAFIDDVRRISEKIQEGNALLDNAWKLRLNTFKDIPTDGDTGIFGDNLILLDSLPDSLPYYAHELVYVLARNSDLLKDADVLSFLRWRLRLLGNLKLFFFAWVIDHATWQQHYQLPKWWLESELEKAKILDVVFVDSTN